MPTKEPRVVGKSENSLAELVMTAEEYAVLESLPEWPYTFELENGERVLFYLGANHSFDPQDPLFEEIKRKIGSFHPDLIMVEGQRGLIEDRERVIEAARRTSLQRAIEEGGESGFVIRLAIEKNVDVTSPEPAFEDEIKHLEKKFDREDIFAYYMARQIVIYQKLIEKEPLESYLRGTVNELAGKSKWPDFNFSLEHFWEISKKLWGVFDVADPGLERAVDPIPWPDTKDSETIVNLIARECGRF